MNDAPNRPAPPQEFELDLGRVGLIVIVPVGLWAFYTTFEGLKDITRQGQTDIIMGTIGAVVGAAAILSLMALSSWKLGTDAAAALTGRTRARGSTGGLIVLIPVFVFFLSLSTFFSYTYYHSNFFGLSSRQLEGERQPRALGTAIITKIVEDAVASKKAEVITRIKASSGASEWIKSTESLDAAAGSGGSRFEAIFKEKQKAIEEAAKQTAIEEAAKLKTANAAREEMAKIEKEIEDAERIVVSINNTIGPEEKNIADLRAAAEADLRKAELAKGGVDTSKKEGCGRICQGHRADAAKNRAEADRIDRGVKPQRDSRQAALKKASDLRQKLPELERVSGTKSTLGAPPIIPVPGATPAPAPGNTPVANSLGGTSGAAPQPAPGTPAAPPVAAGPPNLKSELAALQAARQQFQTDPTLATVVRAEKSCKAMLAAAKEAKLANDIPAEFDCTIRADDTKLLFEELDTFKRVDEGYKKTCSLNGQLGTRLNDIATEVRGKTVKPEEGLVKARKEVQDCVVAAGPVIGSKAVLQSENAMDDFVRDQSLDRNRFTNATSALWRLDGDARLALSVALAQDLLILIYKFLADFYKYSSRQTRVYSVGPAMDLSDNESDSVEIRARKALLRVATPARGDSSRITEEDIRGEHLPDEVEDNLYALLNSLGRQDSVWRASKDVFGIDNAVLREIEIDLHRSLEGRAATSGRTVTGGARQVDHQADQDADSPAERPAAAPSHAAETQPTARRKRRSVRDFAAGIVASAHEMTSAPAEPREAARETPREVTRDAGKPTPAASPQPRPARDAAPAAPTEEQKAASYSWDELRKLNRG
jgi:hypothetical protein